MEKTASYLMKVKSPLGYEDALVKVTALLKEKGFGVLTEIDVKATLKKKINQDFKKYKILGACNPAKAHKTLAADEGIGVFLPCNVVVAEEGEGSTIMAINPYMMSEMFDDPAIKEVGEEVTEIFEDVLEKMKQA